MNNIVSATLGSIGKVCMCKRILKEQTNTIGGIPFYKISTFGGKADCYISKEVYEDYKHRFSFPKKGDVLISAAGTLGKTVVYNGEDAFFQDSNIVWIDNDESKILNDYLLYFYKTNPWIKTHGSTIERLYNDNIRNITISYPEDIEEQKQIIKVLKEIDQKIENNKQISAELESLVKTIYDYWFLQFEFPNEEGKPYKLSGGNMVYNEELKREIPEGWEFDSLRNKYDIKRGISYTSKDIETGIGTPMLNLACVGIDRNYREGEIKYINNDIKEEMKLNPGEMLIATTDLTRNADIVGCPIIVPYDGEEYTYSMDLAKMVITDNTLNKWYVYSALRTNHYHNYIKKWASGTNVLHLNLDGINWYKTILPEKNIQDKYAGIIEPICKKQGSILRENRELASLRDWLLPMLMNGQATFKETA